MKLNSFERVGQILLKYHGLWTLHDSNTVYWWFFNDVEEPTESQLIYCSTKYRHIRWYVLLVKKYPTLGNLNRLALFIKTKSDKRFFKKLLRKLFVEMLTYLDIDLLDFLAQNGGKALRKLANAEIGRREGLMKFVYDI